MISLRMDLSPALARLVNQPAGLIARAGRLAAYRAAEGYAEDVLDWIQAGHSYTPRLRPDRQDQTIEQGISWRPLGEGAVVYSQAPHGQYVEYDTRPHLIRPRPGRKALRWFPSGGGQMIRKVVRHPGTTAQPFFFADLPARQGRMLQAAREAVAEVLDA